MAACGLCRGVFLCTVLLCLVSCIWEFPPEETDALSLGDGATLALKVSLFDTDGFAAADREGEGLPEVEKMHDLRVVITSKADDGSEQVEFNRYLDFRSGDWMYKYGYLDDDRLVFKVSGTNPQKHVYLFANCEPLFEDIFKENAEKGDGVTVHVDPENGLYGDIGANEDWKPLPGEDYIKMLHEATYTNGQLQKWVKTDGGKANGIPMSAEYEITVEPGNTGINGVHVLEAYIVRACNKITFEYVNEKSQHPIFISDWTLSDIAETAFLLPRVKSGSGLDYSGSWIAGYAGHIEANRGDSFDKDNPHDGEEPLYDFDVPSEPVLKGLYYKYGENAEVKGLEVPGVDVSGVPEIPKTKIDEVVHYFPESKNVKNGSEQYTLDFTTSEYSRAEEYTPRKYGPIQLPKVLTLFRNTHVKIRAKIGQGKMGIEVKVHEWDVVDDLEVDCGQGDITSHEG
jgi:hypothetical protein